MRKEKKMKQVLYYNKTQGCFYHTTEKNYNSYVQDSRANHRLEDCKSVEDAYAFIEKMCRWYNDCKPEDFKIIL